MKLSNKALRTEIGLTVSDIPTRLSLYSLHRVQEMLLQYLMINSVFGGSITPEYPLADRHLPVPRTMHRGPSVDLVELESFVGPSMVYTKDEQGRTLGAGPGSRLQTANLNKNASQCQVETDRSSTMPGQLRIHSNLSSIVKDAADAGAPEYQPTDLLNSRNRPELGSAATTVFSRRG